MADTSEQRGGTAATGFGKTEAHFSWMRTRLSCERTLMSWVRTATALIGFGFTLFQFFEQLKRVPGLGAAHHPGMPRVLSVSLVAVGTFALVVALAEYKEILRYLWGEEFKGISGNGDRPAWTPAFMVGTVLAMIGAVTMGGLLWRMTVP